MEMQSVETLQSTESKDSRTDADVAVSYKQCNSMVKLVGGTSNMSMHMKCHHPLLCLDHLWGTNKRPTHLSTSVSTPVWTEILVHVPVHILYRSAAVAGVYLAAEFTEIHAGRSSRDIHDHSKHCHPSHSNEQGH